MTDAWTMLLGPLAGPECSRASRRGWLIWVRMLPAFAAGVVAFFVLWFWWISQQIDPNHQPFNELRSALTIIEGMVVAFAMIMTPAVLAGSLAGEKERGSIGLLLTTRVSASDIVLGRLAGRLSQVAMIELAAVPLLLMMASMAGFGFAPSLTLLVLPISLAFGGGGMALAASSMSRRGRDSLLFLYLLEILILLSPLLAPLGVPWIDRLSPFVTVLPLTWQDEIGPALTTAGAWTLMGSLGLVLASWRLRPSCLAEAEGVKDRRKAKRRVWVPPMDDERPMLWKELHIERVGTLGRAGRWIGGLLVLWLALGSIGLAACSAWGYFRPGAGEWASWAITQSSLWYGNSAIFIGCLIQWAIGLRAAVTISSERERGTWDALLTSPLEGTEIVRGKLWGSLWALKWLVGSALLAWTITFALGGMFWPEYVEQLLGLAVIGPFMSAIGVRTSLHSSTATKAMGDHDRDLVRRLDTGHRDRLGGLPDRRHRLRGRLALCDPGGPDDLQLTPLVPDGLAARPGHRFLCPVHRRGHPRGGRDSRPLRPGRRPDDRRDDRRRPRPLHPRRADGASPAQLEEEG